MVQPKRKRVTTAQTRVFAPAFTISKGEQDGDTCLAFRRGRENYSARVMSRGRGGEGGGSCPTFTVNTMFS